MKAQLKYVYYKNIIYMCVCQFLVVFIIPSVAHNSFVMTYESNGIYHLMVEPMELNWGQEFHHTKSYSIWNDNGDKSLIYIYIYISSWMCTPLISGRDHVSFSSYIHWIKTTSFRFAQPHAFNYSCYL